MKTTKEEILYNALKLFAEKGYGSVSMRDIAKVVGIQGASLYNHFKNKQELFESLVDYCISAANKYFDNNKIPFDDGDDIEMYKNITFERLFGLILQTFGYFFEDEINVLFRKFLIVGQFQFPYLKEIYVKLYYNYTIDFQSKIFNMLIINGEFKKRDPKQIAIEFFGVMFMLIHTVDSLEEAKPLIESHLREFLLNYQLEQSHE